MRDPAPPRDPLPSLGIVLVLVATLVLSLQRAPGTPLVPHAPVVMLAVQLAVGLLALPALLRRGVPRGVRTLLALWALLAGVALVSALASPLAPLALSRALAVFLPTTLLLLLVAVDPRPAETFVRVGRALAIVGTLLGAYGLALARFGTQTGNTQRLRLGPLRLEQLALGGDTPFPRIASLTENPNLLATWLMLALTFTVALHLARRLPTSIALPSALLQGLALLHTSSRAGILGAGLMLVALLGFALSRVLSHRRAALPRARLVAALSLPALAAAAIVAVSPRIAHSDRLTLQLSGRDALWSATWAGAREHLLAGVGFGVSKEAILVPAGHDLSTHSLYLALLAEVGVAGAALFVAVSLLAFWRGGQALRRETTWRPELVAVAAALAVLLGLAAHQAVELHVTRFGPLTLLWAYLVGFVVRTGAADVGRAPRPAARPAARASTVPSAWGTRAPGGAP